MKTTRHILELGGALLNDRNLDGHCGLPKQKSKLLDPSNKRMGEKEIRRVIQTSKVASSPNSPFQSRNAVPASFQRFLQHFGLRTGILTSLLGFEGDEADTTDLTVVGLYD